MKFPSASPAVVHTASGGFVPGSGRPAGPWRPAAEPGATSQTFSGATANTVVVAIPRAADAALFARLAVTRP